MIDNHLLQELVVFAQKGTLNGVANVLNITQPNVSRGLKKLEDQLGVSLFVRHQNKIELNSTGQIAVKKAQAVLAAQKDFTDTVKNYAHKQNQITVSSMAPGPLAWMQHESKRLSRYHLRINQHLLTSEQALASLQRAESRLIFLNEEKVPQGFEARFVGWEYLYLKIGKNSSLADQQRLHFKDLAGLTFIVSQQIGPWRQVIENEIPNAKFIYQENNHALDELTVHSELPLFRSNLTQLGDQLDTEDPDRQRIEIDDPANRMDFYAVYPKSQHKFFTSLFNHLTGTWPQS